MKKNILKYLIEILIVAFGVFLGLYVSEWKSNQQIDKNVSKSLDYILEELYQNKIKLSSSLEYHKVIDSTLKKLTKELDESEFEKPYYSSKTFHLTTIEKWTGMGLPQLEQTSYEGAKISGIFQELDFKIVQSIASAYNQISFNQEFGNSILDKLIQSNSETKVIDVVKTVRLLTSDYLNNEYLLLIELEKTIKRLKEYETQH